VLLFAFAFTKKFNEVLMHLYELFKTGKKQNLTPQAKGVDFFSLRW